MRKYKKEFSIYHHHKYLTDNNTSTMVCSTLSTLIQSFKPHKKMFTMAVKRLGLNDEISLALANFS